MSEAKKTAVLLDLTTLGTDFSREDVEKAANRAVMPSDSCYVEWKGIDPGEPDPAHFMNGVGYKVAVITGINKDGTFVYGAEFTHNNLFGNLVMFNSSAKPELKEGETLGAAKAEAKDKADKQNNRAFGSLVRNMTDGKATVGETTAEMQRAFNQLAAQGQLPIGVYNPSTNKPSYTSYYKPKDSKEKKPVVQQDRADVDWGFTTRASAIQQMKKGNLVPPDVRQFVRNANQVPPKQSGGGDAPGGLGTEPPADE